MLGANNGLISESARLEIAGGNGIGGGTLDIMPDDAIYTFTTKYNGKNYVCITGNHDGGNLDGDFLVKLFISLNLRALLVFL